MGSIDDEALKAAIERIKKDRASASTRNILIVCAAILLCVCIICGTVLAAVALNNQKDVIVEQQYALNMQYAGLLDAITGAEISTSEELWEASTDGDGISVAGDSNTISGGDMIGVERKEVEENDNH